MIGIRNRRTVEIYFILYLAALVFLLPGPKDATEEKQDIARKFLDFPFNLQLEKTALSCRIKMTESGPEILYLDSVNTIYYSGEVEDVKFEFVIEDQSKNVSLNLNSDNSLDTKFFRFYENSRNKTATFTWKPPFSTGPNASYLVKVIASAKPKLSDDELRALPFSNARITKTTQFSLNVLAINSVIARESTSTIDTIYQITESIFQQPANQPEIVNKVPENFQLITSKPVIEAMAFKRWTHVIYSSNIDLIRDLADKKPKISIKLENAKSKGKAEIIDIQSDKMIIHGKTPSIGNMIVNISVERFDNKTVETSFIVTPLLFEQPKYDSYMYPEKRYMIDPKLPLTDQKSYALLKLNNEVVIKSQQGEAFPFTPTIKDTGKTFILERYVDNNKLAESNRIKIIPFKNPGIHRIYEIGSKKIEVITKAYGRYFNKQNEIVRLIVTGNAVCKDQRGDIHDDKTDLIRTQKFHIVPADPDEPFNFTIKAVDVRGKVSIEKPYRE